MYEQCMWTRKHFNGSPMAIIVVVKCTIWASILCNFSLLNGELIDSVPNNEKSNKTKGIQGTAQCTQGYFKQLSNWFQLEYGKRSADMKDIQISDMEEGGSRNI